MSRKLMLFILFFSLISCQDGLADGELLTEEIKNYETPTFDILVPSYCVNKVMDTLAFYNLRKEKDFKYRKFVGLYDAYNHIEGYISLIPNNKYTMDYMLKISEKLQSKCFADSSINISRDGNEWKKLGEKVEIYRKKGLNIHSIKVTEKEIKIFVNIEEFKEKVLSVN